MTQFYANGGAEATEEARIKGEIRGKAAQTIMEPSSSYITHVQSAVCKSQSSNVQPYGMGELSLTRGPRE